jgi:hypothetical protein
MVPSSIESDRRGMTTSGMPGCYEATIGAVSSLAGTGRANRSLIGDWMRP